MGIWLYLPNPSCMQFKHPELLWALLLLLLPIIIHLFQLRRFKKTAFTNVKLLQEVVSQSRKSNRLKKWLLLISRLGLIAAAVIAFAQPFQAEEKALTERDLVIFLDDSFSMQAQDQDGTLFTNATQSILRGLSRDQSFSLFTNNRTFRNVTIREVQESLLELEPSPHQLTLEEVFLKADGLFPQQAGHQRELLLISDFQDRLGNMPTTWPEGLQVRAVKLEPESSANVAVDSLFVSRTNPTSLEVTALLQSNGQTQDIPVSLFDDRQLIAKSSASFDQGLESRVVFTLPRDEMINGRIEITDNSLSYDNTLYFNLGEQEKINVLEIYGQSNRFLSRIFTEEEFDFISTPPSGLNYSEIEDQNLIILNELNSLPLALQNSLTAFRSDGGHIAIIPAEDIDLNGYNSFLASYYGSRLQEQSGDSLSITNINFDHPLYRIVFEKRVENFQYPVASLHYPLESQAPVALSYADNSGFLVGTQGWYLFTAPLSEASCNFIRSPLVVPTFYEMGKQSLALPDLYYSLGERSEIDIPIPIAQDQIIEVAREDYEFIPLQQSFAKKTRLSFIDNPVADGIYTILVQEDSLKNISFNYPRTESKLSYSELSENDQLRVASEVDSVFEQLEAENRIRELWKWFVILALIFVLAEIGIQKFIS